MAGSGKTTVTSYIIQELLADVGTPRISVAAYTAKAASVLRRKFAARGLPPDRVTAVTCHKLFTIRPIDRLQILQRRRDLLAQTRMSALVSASKDTYATADMMALKLVALDAEIERTLASKDMLRWEYRDPAELATDVDIIIIDEASMFPLEFDRIAKASGVPTLYVGDDNQLRPPSGDGYDMSGAEHRLTEIHRQAAHSRILGLSRDIVAAGDMVYARSLPAIDGDVVYAEHGDPAHYIPRTKTGTGFPASVQCITYTNEERRKMNRHIRHKIVIPRAQSLHTASTRAVWNYGTQSYLPLPGEVLVCLQNIDMYRAEGTLRDVDDMETKLARMKSRKSVGVAPPVPSMKRLCNGTRLLVLDYDHYDADKPHILTARVHVLDDPDCEGEYVLRLGVNDLMGSDYSAAYISDKGADKDTLADREYTMHRGYIRGQKRGRGFPSSEARIAVEVAYAYAVTCYKAQGSEWPHIILSRDGDMLKRYGRDPLDCARHFYTAVTRAQSKLTVLAYSGYVTPRCVS
jgi:UvrD-like helicase C-terminal domain/AAA domain